MNAQSSIIGMTLHTHMPRRDHIELVTKDNRPCHLRDGTEVLVMQLSEWFQREHHLDASICPAVFEIHGDLTVEQQCCLRFGQHIVPLSEFDTGVTVQVTGAPLPRGSIAESIGQTLQQS